MNCIHHKDTPLDDQGKCPKCGWTKNRPKDAKRRQDDRCIFEHDGRRCPFPATWGDHPYRDVTYCSFHAEPDNRNHQLDQDAFFSTFAKNAECVKDTLNEWKDDWREQMIQEKIAANPGWQRHPRESKSDYDRRMLNLCLRKAKQLSVKLSGGK